MTDPADRLELEPRLYPNRSGVDELSVSGINARLQTLIEESSAYSDIDRQSLVLDAMIERDRNRNLADADTQSEEHELLTGNIDAICKLYGRTPSLTYVDLVTVNTKLADTRTANRTPDGRQKEAKIYEYRARVEDALFIAQSRMFDIKQSQLGDKPPQLGYVDIMVAAILIEQAIEAYRNIPNISPTLSEDERSGAAEVFAGNQLLLLGLTRSPALTLLSVDLGLIEDEAVDDMIGSLPYPGKFGEIIDHRRKLNADREYQEREERVRRQLRKMPRMDYVMGFITDKLSLAEEEVEGYYSTNLGIN